MRATILKLELFLFTAMVTFQNPAYFNNIYRSRGSEVIGAGNTLDNSPFSKIKGDNNRVSDVSRRKRSDSSDYANG